MRRISRKNNRNKKLALKQSKIKQISMKELGNMLKNKVIRGLLSNTKERYSRNYNNFGD